MRRCSAEVHFPMEATSPLERCGVRGWTPNSLDMAHRISLVLSFDEEFHEPLYDALEVGNKTFTRMRHTSTTELEALTANSHSSQRCKNHQAGARLHNSIGGARLVPAAPKATRMTNDELELQQGYKLQALSRVEGKIKSLWWKCRSRSPLSNPRRARCLSE